jgi:hypothetical protein
MSCLLQKTSGILLELALLLFPAQTPRYALSGKILCAKQKISLRKARKLYAFVFKQCALVFENQSTLLLHVMRPRRVQKFTVSPAPKQNLR